MAPAAVTACAPRACLTTPAAGYLSGQGVAVSLINQRLQRSALAGGAPPPSVHLDQAQAVHSFLLQQQRLRRITSAALVLESTPEALRFDVQQQLKPLLACLSELGLSQEQTTSVFRGLRRHRDQAAAFLELPPEELQRRYFWLCQHLALEGATAAAYLAASPTLLLAEPADAAAVVRWLHASPGWRRQALRRNLAAHAQILLTPVAQLEAAAATLQLRLDASTDELCLLLALAPRLLALPQGELEAAAAAHPAAWRLAGAYMDRPALLMRDAAEALHLQVATLYLMQRHGLSRQQPWGGTTLQQLRAELQQFATARDWQQFHTPRNLLLALTGEVGELAEIFQWRGEVATGLPDFTPAERQQVGEELSDVLLYLIRLADACGVDLPAAALSKMKANGVKYPVERAFGTAAKYTQLAAEARGSSA
ncbi:dCTP pyrophosphatase 1-like [Micractinium conductrix]|uniref:dCTP pyrophosphatase 1-like n=1 Tax=Micractinium conductrix TaxID=554055 RepID=A0A2P6VQK5_9CHLO|nr:dCTP pyrophosphatase 1-like [Micractinium conductrix]|eukprot:PSC76378.1 dCTP pyrophosphatase 1-like [Micractinium conductrix]